MTKILLSTLSNTLKKPQRVPFVITYNPALRSISSIIRKHFNILTSSPRCHNVFQTITTVGFRRSSNLKNYLVHHCSYTFHATGETRHITHNVNCNSNNFIHMVQSAIVALNNTLEKPNKRLKDRFNKHRRPVDKPTNVSKPTTVLEHILTNNHTATDISLIPHFTIHSNRDSVRKARKANLINIANTREGFRS